MLHTFAAMARILLVEDEPALARAIGLNLKLEGHEITQLGNGQTAIHELEERHSHYELVILDVMLPEKDGFDVCKSLRKLNEALPVLMLSARNSPEDKVLGLRAGADDYLGKPFHLDEFLLRVKSLLRRGQPSAAPQITDAVHIGNALIDFKSFTITSGGTSRMLSRKEAGLLRMLLRSVNHAVSRQDILLEVWGGEDISARSIDNFVMNLRREIEPKPNRPDFLLSIRGVGYMLKM
jgi:two-component system alkaline phosphatase synthesis response regulator PhoP